jgi:hypothetical protein
VTESLFETADDDAESTGDDRRKLVIAGTAIGALALGGVAYLLLSGGGGGESFVVKPGVRKSPTAAAGSPSTSPSPEAVLETANAAFNDPFEVPPRILQALAPPVTAAAPTSAKPADASPSPGTGTGVGTGTGSGTGTPGPTTVSPRVQYLQLLGAKQKGSTWVVTVRTQKGVCTGVKTGATKVCGTDFSFEGEDEQAGTATFVFVFGEVQGGNLVPNPKQKATPVKAGNNALVAVNGKVDGGISAE